MDNNSMRGASSISDSGRATYIVDTIESKCKAFRKMFGCDCPDEFRHRIVKITNTKMNYAPLDPYPQYFFKHLDEKGTPPDCQKGGILEPLSREKAVDLFVKDVIKARAQNISRAIADNPEGYTKTKLTRGEGQDYMYDRLAEVLRGESISSNEDAKNVVKEVYTQVQIKDGIEHALKMGLLVNVNIDNPNSNRIDCYPREA